MDNKLRGATMNECTGGDWRYEVERYGVLLYDGYEVEEHQYVIEAEGKVIARIDSRLSDAEQEAYARLMVSAPKMLEALEAVKQYINGRQFYEMCPQTVDKVLDAIKAAKEVE